MNVSVNNPSSVREFAFAKSRAFKNGRWIGCEELNWSVTDIATTHGVMLVERLRTVGGQLMDSSLHTERLRTSASLVGLVCNDLFASMDSLLQELIQYNYNHISHHGDVGIVVLISPGDPGHDKSTPFTPTFMMHLTPIPFVTLSKWYERGCCLHVSQTRNVPPESWSPWIKTRSRLQYYLADNPVEATMAVNGSDFRPLTNTSKSESIAVLLSIQGFVTETSISNLLILDQRGKIRSPSKGSILQGVSLATVEELAAKTGEIVEYTDLTAPDFAEAKEILMTGTTGFVWSAIEFEGVQIGDGKPGPLCLSLQKAWENRIDFDFVSQAAEIACRAKKSTHGS